MLKFLLVELRLEYMQSRDVEPLHKRVFIHSFDIVFFDNIIDATQNNLEHTVNTFLLINPLF